MMPIHLIDMGATPLKVFATVVVVTQAVLFHINAVETARGPIGQAHPRTLAAVSAFTILVQGLVLLAIWA